MALVFCLGIALVACGGEDRRQDRESSTPLQTYTVRGEVAVLPGPDRPPGRITIRHEAIPEFVGPSGEVVGMEAMTMHFQLAEGVSTADLAPGDPILFTFEVDWASGSLPMVVRLEALPEESRRGPEAAGSAASGHAHPGAATD
jgi:Cu/Ag efflux protein CusF